MSFFFEGSNRTRPARDLHSSPTGYQERSRGGPEGSRTVNGMVTWPMNVVQRYFNRATVSIADGSIKTYLHNVALLDSVTARNGVQTKTQQVEPGQSVLVQYRSGSSTAPLILGAITTMGEWGPFIRNGTLYGIDDLTEMSGVTPMTTSVLPSIVNNDWLGVWHVPPMRGLRDEDPANGNDAQAGSIPGPLVELVDRFGNVSNILYGEGESNHYGDDDFTQGYLDGMAGRAVQNAEQAVRQSTTNRKHTDNAKSIHSRGKFEKVEDSGLEVLKGHDFFKEGQKGALRLIDTALDQLQDAIDVADVHIRWLRRYSEWYLNRYLRTWGRLGGTGIQAIADHVPPPLQYAVRAIFGGYQIPPTFHAAIRLSVNFARGPGPSLGINRWELYKTASPLPIVSAARLALGRGNRSSAGAAEATPALPYTPFLHITPELNDLNITKHPEDALSVYLAVMGLQNSRHLVAHCRSYFMDQSLTGLASALMVIAPNRDRLLCGCVLLFFGQKLSEVEAQLSFLLGKSLPETWTTVLRSANPLFALQDLGLRATQPDSWLKGTEGMIEWCRENQLDSIVELLCSANALEFFSELCSRGSGASFDMLPEERARLTGLIHRAFEIPVFGDTLPV